MLRKVLLLLIPLVAFGCAGQGTFSGTTPYVGSYSGTWTSPANGHTGTLTLSISPHATVVGSYVDTTANVSGQVSGTVAQSGGFRATVVMSTSGTSPMSGQFSIVDPGGASAVLSGNATVGAGASGQSISFALPADTATGPSAFAGSYTGSWTSPLNGHFGTLSMTVSSDSKIVGSFADAYASTTGVISGTVDQNGGFVSTVTGAGAPATLSGQLSISKGVLSGNANFATGSSTEALSFTLSGSQSTSTYAGSFAGAWSSPATGHTGTISLTVSPTATMTGSFVDTTANTTGAISGNVSPTGAFNATITLGSGGIEGLAGQFTSANGGLSGNATLSVGGASQPLSFTLTTGSASSYAGSFTGSWLSATSGHTGTISWTIATDAQIIGTYIDTTSATAGAISGTVDQNGHFNSTLRFSNSTSDSFTGELTIENGGSPTANLSGNGTLNTGAPQTISFTMPETPVVSPYYGSFAGTWGTPSITSPTDSGTISWTIAPDGTIVGTFFDAHAGTYGIMFGEVDNDGKFSIAVTVNGIVTAKLAGQMSYAIGSVVPPATTPPGVETGDGTFTAGSSVLPLQLAMSGTNHNTTEGTFIKPATSLAPAGKTVRANPSARVRR